MCMKFKDKLVSQGCREEYCEYGHATEILCWVYDVLGGLYLTRLSGPMSSKAGSRSGDPWSFPKRADFSILIFWTLCQKAMGAEAEDLILFFEWLGVFYLLVSGWRWNGAKSCIEPAEISPKVFCKKHEWRLLDQFVQQSQRPIAVMDVHLVVKIIEQGGD